MAIEYLGITETTLLDFPGEVAASIFTPGCNFRCPYCHNPELVFGHAAGDEITVSQFFDFLEKRKTVLGGICITGGEPLIHGDLPELIKDIKKRGLKVKLDTNGSFPDRLEKAGADYIAMDIKTRPSKYSLLGDSLPADMEDRLAASIAWLTGGSRPHHFRTTAVPGIIDSEDFREILRLIPREKIYYLSGFRPGKTLDPAFSDLEPYPQEEMERWKLLAEDAGMECILRMNRPVGAAG